MELKMEEGLEIGGVDVVVARVLSEDDRFLTVEIAKNNDEKFTLDQEIPDQFHTMIFLKMVDGQAVAWKPWEEE
jgi:hypothetical protein